MCETLELNIQQDVWQTFQVSGVHNYSDSNNDWTPYQRQFSQTNHESSITTDVQYNYNYIDCSQPSSSSSTISSSESSSSASTLSIDDYLDILTKDSSSPISSINFDDIADDDEQALPFVEPSIALSIDSPLSSPPSPYSLPSHPCSPISLESSLSPSPSPSYTSSSSYSRSSSPTSSLSPSSPGSPSSLGLRLTRKFKPTDLLKKRDKNNISAKIYRKNSKVRRNKLEVELDQQEDRNRQLKHQFDVQLIKYSELLNLFKIALEKNWSYELNELARKQFNKVRQLAPDRNDIWGDFCQIFG